MIWKSFAGDGSYMYSWTLIRLIFQHYLPLRFVQKLMAHIIWVKTAYVALAYVVN